MSYGTPPPPAGYGSPAYGGPAPNHPKAVLILVLGILSLVVCGILGIFAWVMGNGALREIDSSGGALGGRGMVQAGRICGMIATILMILGIVFVVILVAVGGTSNA